MRVPNEFECYPAEAPQGPLKRHTAALIPFPMSYRHTARSVSQEAYRTLWATLPDRAEKWRRIGNMDQVLGVGRPIHTISKQVFATAIEDMQQLGMPEDVIGQHLEDFGSLMTWAVGRGFAEFG
jgi:hypothetical protein